MSKDILDELLNKFKNHIKEDKKIVKTYPMKASWIKARNQMEKALDESSIADQKYKIYKQQFWGLVEREIGYNKSLSVNDKNKEIEEYEN